MQVFWPSAKQKHTGFQYLLLKVIFKLKAIFYFPFSTVLNCVQQTQISKVIVLSLLLLHLSVGRAWRNIVTFYTLTTHCGLFHAVLFHAAMCLSLPCRIVLFCAMPCCSVPCRADLCHAVLICDMLCCSVTCCTILHCNVPCCPAAVFFISVSVHFTLKSIKTQRGYYYG